MSKGLKNTPQLALALMMAITPAVGSTTEELLQDTLKSILISTFALLSIWFLFQQQKEKKIFHTINFIPFILCAYALCSAAWSHTYLGLVETIRWFIFAIIVFVTSNTTSHRGIIQIVWGIHIGAVCASIWAILQFCIDFRLFPQGPNPASTFINRNIFAEYLVCTIPFSVFLAFNVKHKISVISIAISAGLGVSALMMTGTRSALLALIIFGIGSPLILWIFRNQVNSKNWNTKYTLLSFSAFLLIIFLTSSIQTRNTKITAEFGPITGLERAVARTVSMGRATSATDLSVAMRTQMWRATTRMISANPVFGVGAGSWEVQIPLYQSNKSQLEDDYYAHNEFLQLIAEYGIFGWIAICSIVLYFFQSAARTIQSKRTRFSRDRLLRVLTLFSLFMIFIVSNAGFPWHMATTGALLALGLGFIMRSDVYMSTNNSNLRNIYVWKIKHSSIVIYLIAAMLALTSYISLMAVLAERNIVRAIHIAMAISQSSNPNHPVWTDEKIEMLKLLKSGIEINKHYRKLTPVAGDIIAGWGDWKNATWIWESVLESRPFVTALLTNVARGYLQRGDLADAQKYIDRANDLHSTAASLQSVEVILLSMSGQDAKAIARARELINSDSADYDLLQAAYVLGKRNNDLALVGSALKERIRKYPESASKDRQLLQESVNAMGLTVQQ